MYCRCVPCMCMLENFRSMSHLGYGTSGFARNCLTFNVRTNILPFGLCDALFRILNTVSSFAIARARAYTKSKLPLETTWRRAGGYSATTNDAVTSHTRACNGVQACQRGVRACARLGVVLWDFNAECTRSPHTGSALTQHSLVTCNTTPY